MFIKRTRVSIAFLVLGLFYISACTRHEEANARSKNNGAVKVFKPVISMDNERRLQEAVENGYHVWRKNAVDAAHAALVNEGVNVTINDLKLLSENGKEAVVTAQDKRMTHYKIICQRLIKPDGIWTATEIDMVTLNVMEEMEGKSN